MRTTMRALWALTTEMLTKAGRAPAALAALALLAATLAPAGPATAQGAGYRLNPGDTIAVEVLEDSSLNREILVLPDGSFNFPFAGTVRAAGRTAGQIQASIAEGIASNFAAPPNVFVTVRSLREVVRRAPAAPAAPVTISIYYLGEVATPGVREVPPGTTILQALSQSGGFTPFAATKRIQLRRTNPHTGQQSVSVIDYRAIANGAILRNDVRLVDGDVIVVPERRLFE